MASSSTSYVHKSFKYEVFLSFRGEDTRKNFVDHLYSALQRKSIRTYKDDVNIEKGKKISDELIKSIQDSKFYIIVFSKTYASSSWCLDELVKIMECQKTAEQTAYPVFYDVEPSEVRKQSGIVGEAFAKHKKEEAAGKWKKALEEASFLAGWELKNTADGIDGKLIGMETRIKDVVSSLEMDFDDVRMIGIKGMGGGGKTTLARAVFDQISTQFEDLLNEQSIIIRSVHDGKKLMKKMMCGTKVLIVLDDVDHIDQLEALACEPSWFKRGSRIIITTRDEQVLIAHRVNFIRDVNLLSHEEAICLFSRYAFGKDIPIQGYEKLSGQVALYAAGLPLTIRVLGSFLCGKNDLEWIDALERLKTIPLKETLEKLELSYISLEEDYKQIFLDVACLLKGSPKDEAIRVLESCGFHALNGLRVLQQKSLMDISGHGYLGMHDHIVEMGRNIGTKATRCIKLGTWKLNPEIVMKGLGNMKKLRYLHLSCANAHFSSDWRVYAVLNKLRFLDLNNSMLRTFDMGLTPNLEMLSLEGCDDLVEVHMLVGCPRLKSLDLGYTKLRTVNLGLCPNLEKLSLKDCFDLVELQMSSKCLKLGYLDLSHSKLRTFDLGLTPNLECLNLHKCLDFVDLRMHIACTKMKFLDLSYSKLRSLNSRFIPNLETLSLERCDDLIELHMPVECLQLKSLNLNHSKLRTLDLGKSPNLETLSLIDCYHLVELHGVGCLEKLAYLNVSGCLRFKSFLCQRQVNSHRVGSELHLSMEPLEICPLHPDTNLPKFRLTCLYKEDGPSINENLEKLVPFGLCACTNLESFSQSICGLQYLTKLTLEGSIPEVPKDLHMLQCLEELTLKSRKIKHLPDSICMLKDLKSLKLQSCWYLEKLPEDLGRLNL
ncbi:hypothetical protein OSB04_016463 [Centaurea solstitialis]|uniref:TIR domain-containing protein n=1 Tax=Centaurea solstitialis TaxID=347529 RepID=A0AA38T109_9ASTR|nr:hypothetical protein OSB04_016463 [Centaurea solstitialis]